MFHTASALLFWGAAPLAALIAFVVDKPLRTEGRFVLAGAIVSSCVGLAYLLSATNCWESWSGLNCPSAETTLAFRLAGGVGLAQAALLAACIGVPRRPTRRVLFGLCVPVAAGLFYPLIISIGVFLVVGWWAGLGWFIVKAPPLRTREH